jgi:hypothetical protein
MKTQYDLCLAWNWKHDEDFVSLLNETCRSHGLSLLEITPRNLDKTLQVLADGHIACRAFFDRASDEDIRFIPIEQWARDHSVFRINPRERAVRAWNKAIMHFALIEAGLHTPYTLVLPSYEEEPDLPTIDLTPLGESFVVKPAHGGGGEGVVTGASSLSQVNVARQEFSADRYLLQANIVPARLQSRLAWFRVIYCASAVYLCWWDPHTHIYIPVTVTEERHFGLGPLRDMTTTIARVCGLGLFSTEIALNTDGLWIVVDYVNDQMDLRLQSKTSDGVPDNIAYDIAERLVALVEEQEFFHIES